VGIISEESLNKLRQRIDLQEVVASHVDLKRFGSSFKALCPFHNEKTPSFIVNKGDSHYHCFGCGAHGDAIAFLMSYLKMSFSDAVESLAEKFGVTLDYLEKEKEEKGINKSKLKEALKEAKRFYHFYLLHTDEGHIALEYLYQRGIDLDFIYLFEIGFSPRSSPIFSQYMKEKGFDLTTLEQVGLYHSSSKAKVKDFFQNRVMFPIKDALGQVVGFSARKIQEETFGPKYINTPETPLFKKSQILYGFSECRKRIAKDKKAIIVEGQIDALRLIQEGLDCTVAGQGTAFTEEHANELIKLGVQEVFVAFDGDEAGRQGAIKVGDFFQKEGVDVKIVLLSEKQDPDSVLREFGPVAFKEHLESAVDYLAYLVSELSKTIDPSTPSGKHQLTLALKKRIRGWNHPLMVHESLKKVAKILDIPEHLIQSKEELSQEVFIKKSETVTKQEIDPQRILESDFLRWVILYGTKDNVSEIAVNNISFEELVVPICKKVYKLYLESYQNQNVLDVLSLGMKLQTVEEQLFLSEVLQKRVNGEKAKEGVVSTIKKILERNWLNERERIKIEIQKGFCSQEQAFELAKRFDELRKNPPVIKEIAQ
jgi:DNA primase